MDKKSDINKQISEYLANHAKPIEVDTTFTDKYGADDIESRAIIAENTKPVETPKAIEPKIPKLVIENTNKQILEYLAKYAKNENEVDVTFTKQYNPEVLNETTKYNSNFVVEKAEILTPTPNVNKIYNHKKIVEKPKVKQSHKKVESSIIEQYNIQQPLISPIHERYFVEDTVTQQYVDIQDTPVPEVDTENVIIDVKKFKSDLTSEISTALSKKFAIYMGGGGSNAVQYANGGIMTGNLNIIGQILSGGNDLVKIFNTSNTADSISVYSNVNTNSASWVRGDSVYSSINSNSGSWNSSYTTLQSNSAVWNNDLIYAEQVIGTGVITGGQLTVNSNLSTFDLAGGTGRIVNNWTDPTNPTVTTVTWSTSTGIADAYRLNNVVTNILLDSTGNIVQQSAAPSVTDFRNYIYLGKTVHQTLSNITTTATYPQLQYGLSLTVSDVLYALGVINVTGNTLSNAGATLQINKAAGSLLKAGANRINNTQSPNIVTINSATPLIFQYQYQNSTGGFTASAATTYVIASAYDAGAGVLGTVDGSHWTVQRVYLYPTGVTNITFGQKLYSSVATAINNIFTENPIINPQVIDAALIGALVLKGDTTDLSDTTNNYIISYGKFGGSAGSGAGAGAAVAGPGSSISNSIALFSGTAGTILQDSNAIIDTSGNATFHGNISANNFNNSNWNSVVSTVSSTSANWNSVVSSVNSTSANWNSVYTTVNANSAVFTNVQSSSANWNSVVASVNSTSARWNSAYTTVNANSATWTSPSNFIRNYNAQTSTYTVAVSDYTINCTANTFTIYLPTATGIQGQLYNIKNSGTGTITVSGYHAELIDGQNIQTLLQWNSMSIQSTNVGWIII